MSRIRPEILMVILIVLVVLVISCVTYVFINSRFVVNKLPDEEYHFVTGSIEFYCISNVSNLYGNLRINGDDYLIKTRYADTIINRISLNNEYTFKWKWEYVNDDMEVAKVCYQIDSDDYTLWELRTPKEAFGILLLGGFISTIIFFIVAWKKGRRFDLG